MFKYIVKRLLISLVILLGVSIIIYTLVRMMPMDYIDRKFASLLTNGNMKEEDVLKFKEIYGLADNSFMGILDGYFKWLGNMLKGDLGESFLKGKPVSDVIVENMGISFLIAIIATVLQFAIAIPLGVTSATHQYSVRDYIVTIMTMIGLSFPTYFFAAIVVKFFSVELGWFPNMGLQNTNTTFQEGFQGQLAKLGDQAYYLVLPIFVSVVLSLGG
ncbi:MAG: ABC transporter permease, partial [Acholeplasmatales bacterium]|nr:ABC transporter permease [Acholeplasmatales bacterium]